MMPLKRPMIGMLLGCCARMKVSHLPLHESLLSFLSILILKMNVLIGNCRGVLNSYFQNIVNDMVHSHYHAIMIITETKTSGS